MAKYVNVRAWVLYVFGKAHILYKIWTFQVKGHILERKTPITYHIP